MSDPINHTIRASDAERDSVGEALRRHHADGRLDTEELQERISRCYSAQTRGELDRLLVDMPGEAIRGRAAGGQRLPRWWPVAAIVLLLAMWGGPGWHHHGYHPILPLLLVAFVGLRIVWRTRRYAPAADSRP